MEYKILSMMLIAVMALSMIAPLALAEELAVEDNVTAEPMLISTETSSTDQVSEETEAELELTEEVSNQGVAWKQFKLWFTFNQEKKIERELELAKIRLAQANRAAQNGNSEAAEKAMEAHERIMNRVQEKIEKLDGATTAEGLNASAVKLIGLERALQVHERRVAYLGSVLETANLTEAQRTRLETKLQSMEENADKLTQLQERKMEKIKTRVMAVRNMTEEEANEFVEQKQEQIKEKVQAKIQAGQSEETEESGEQEQEQTQVQQQTQAGQA